MKVKETEIRSLESIMEDVNKLQPADNAKKEMILVFAQGMAAGEALGYNKAIREVINGTIPTN